MLRRIVIALIDFYRNGVSPLTPPTGRFTPSCSAYAREAVEAHGVARGGWLFLRRFARCHPFGGKGYDPVPEARPGTPLPQLGAGHPAGSERRA